MTDHDELPQLRLKRTVELFPASDGSIYLVRGADRAEFVVDDDADGRQLALLELLRAGAEDLEALGHALDAAGFPSSPGALRGAVEDLERLGLLEEPTGPAEALLSQEQRTRYDRQLAYFADMRPGEAAAMQARLAAATVTIVGVGGLGTWTASALACAGVGRLVLVDDDRVELGNLNRQILYRRADVGRRKVEVAREALGAFDPQLEVVAVPERVRGQDGARAAVAGADFVVDTADWPPYEIGRWLDAACVAAGIPRISAGQAPPRIRIGPTYVPGLTGCLECQERAGRRDFPLYDELAASRRARPTVAATLGPASGLIGSAIAMDVLHHLTGLCAPATLGAGLLVDLRDLSVVREPVERDPGCPRCAGCPPPSLEL